MMVLRVPTTPSKHGGVAVRRSTSNKNGPMQLAPSTLFAESDCSDIFGFIISYRVRVKLLIAQSPLNAAVIADLPVFITTKTPTAIENDTYSSPFDEKCPDSEHSTVTFRNRR